MLKPLQCSDTLPGPQMPSISKHMYVCMYVAAREPWECGWGAWVSDEDMGWDAFKLAIAGCLLLIAYCLSPVVYCLLSIAYCLLLYCILPVACITLNNSEDGQGRGGNYATRLCYIIYIYMDPVFFMYLSMHRVSCIAAYLHQCIICMHM